MAACWGAGGVLHSQWRALAREEEEAVKAGAIRPCLGQANRSIPDQRQAVQTLMTDRGDSL